MNLQIHSGISRINNARWIFTDAKQSLFVFFSFFRRRHCFHTIISHFTRSGKKITAAVNQFVKITLFVELRFDLWKLTEILFSTNFYLLFNSQVLNVGFMFRCNLFLFSHGYIEKKVSLKLIQFQKRLINLIFILRLVRISTLIRLFLLAILKQLMQWLR